MGRGTLLAFTAIVLLGGINGTAIRVGNAELGPFWGATLRFGLAALILFGIVGVRRLPLPRGRALLGSALYGLLSFGITFALVNWALVETPAGLAQVILALVPLLTLLLAVVQGAERFRIQNAAGSLVSLAGVALVFGERLGGDVPLLSMLAILLAAVLVAEANVVAKRLPRCNPVANNAIGMGVGAVVLLALTLVSGERLALPVRPETLVALGYLALIGSVVVFNLYLVVIQRWTASATSYALLLMPLVSVSVAAVVLNEPITPILVLGGVLVLAGVYLGAFAPSIARPLPALFPRRPQQPAAAEPGPPTIVIPTCP
jgi:drug/metabolite transporter (DMT)-like permease